MPIRFRCFDGPGTGSSAPPVREDADAEGTIMGKQDGKVAIVTGAARGLGRAYAKRLAGLGAKVAVADLNLHSYEEFEAEAKDMAADSTVAEIEAAESSPGNACLIASGRSDLVFLVGRFLSTARFTTDDLYWRESTQVEAFRQAE
jgi:NAD(P)-dependent dehydrogenase (short-subunit alcohol dehydrogenase family)